MQRGTARRAATILLGIVTVVLVILSIFLIIQIQNAQAPSQAFACSNDDRFGSVGDCVDSCRNGCYGTEFESQCINGCGDACNRLCNSDVNGDTCGDNECTGGENAGNCPGDCGGSSGNDDDDDDNGNNDGGNNNNGGSGSDNNGGSNNDSCEVSAPDGIFGKIEISGCDGTFELLRFTRTMNGPDDDCFVNQSDQENFSTVRVGNGTHSANPGTCQCQQIDVIDDNGLINQGAFLAGVKDGNWSDSCVATTGGNDDDDDNNNGGFICNNNFQCVRVSGSGDYSSRGSCETNCIEDQPICGDMCSSDSMCPTGHSCVNSFCALDGCTGDNCFNGCSPLCAGPCDATDANSCPQDHVCSPETELCILAECTELGVNCDTQQCRVILPETSLFDEDNRNLMIGILMIITAILLVRFNIIGAILNFNFPELIKLQDNSEKREREERNRKRSKFEDRFDLD